MTCLTAKRKDRIKVVENGRKRIIDGDYTGKIESVDVKLLKAMLSKGYVPVIPPFAISENHELVNVNGDRAAAHVAKALGADTIVNLCDVQGVLRDGNVISEIRKGELEEIRKEVNGGMSMKLFAANEALDFGIERFTISSGNGTRPVTKALDSEGTVILNE
jgi:acetylglutamate/LysW-gamma-L-alpha-aminoadipate kinase